MATIVKVMLYRKEESLACLLTAYYELALDKESYYYAIDNENFKWLSFVWAFGKNYLLSRNSESAKTVNVKELLGMIKLVNSQGQGDPKRIYRCCE